MKMSSLFSVFIVTGNLPSHILQVISPTPQSTSRTPQTMSRTPQTTPCTPHIRKTPDTKGLLMTNRYCIEISELQRKVYVDVKRAYMIRFNQSTVSLTGLIGFVILN